MACRLPLMSCNPLIYWTPTTVPPPHDACALAFLTSSLVSISICRPALMLPQNCSSSGINPLASERVKIRSLEKGKPESDMGEDPSLLTFHYRHNGLP